MNDFLGQLLAKFAFAVRIYPALTIAAGFRAETGQRWHMRHLWTRSVVSCRL